MTCLPLNLSRPAIPAFFLPSGAGSLNLSFGTPGVTCCQFSVPAYKPQIPLPALGLLATAQDALQALLASQMTILDTIDLPNCCTDKAT